MARLPKPKLVKVTIIPDENVEERKKTFHSLVRTAMERKIIAERQQGMKDGTSDT
ncbi:hypothetical protein [Anaeromicrobium sediminis]|uniref:hypothetical protein n=1 Tax=Anaeromicrobium sediminis TaxID=1478221 RepID=UPI001595F7F3|nr:hypothetical protein [Anaeromicrobium sediminis]